MTATVQPLWHVSCPDCSLARNYPDEAVALRVMEEHNQPHGCPGQATWFDLNPPRRGAA